MNRRTKMTALSSVLLLALSLVVGSLYMVAAGTEQDDATVSNPPISVGGWRMRGRFLCGLDEEQRQELKEKILAMRDEGATTDEIRTYVREYLEELGIELPEPNAIVPKLTDEQLKGLEQLRAEVEELVRQRLQELGIDKSFMRRLPGFGHRGGVCPNNGGP
jgi:hypothetical protein